jgi:para-nitrobenzyl esterase
MRARPTRLLVAALAASLGGCGSPSSTTPSDGGGDAAPPMQSTTITTKQGVVNGSVDGATRAFLGIPYAAAPTGANRFRPPQPAPLLAAPLDATKYGPQCPQIGAASGMYDATDSEDCLSLNVWTPSVIAAPRPVMVWIHGGGFILGSGSEATYVGANLSAAGDVVVVTINYRLGPLGFLALPSLEGEDPMRASSGDYGIEDQRAALKWVQANIAAFGGDPGNVTLFGESAGGGSTCVHMVSPESQGLFHKAIVESGFCTLVVQQKATAQMQGQALATALGCTSADAAMQRACLRGVTAKQVTTALPLKNGLLFGDGAAWSPVVDGVNVTDLPAKLFASGKASKVPLIIGANGDEGTLFFALAGGMIDMSTFKSTLALFMTPAQADKVIAQYPAAKYQSAQDAAIHVLDDIVLCDARRVARAQAAAGNAVYYYNFTHPTQFILPNLGAFHSAELPFVFGNPYVYIPLKPEEMPLSTAMQRYWTDLATYGAPAAPVEPPQAFAWPRYDAAGDKNIVLDLTLSVNTGLRKEACDFWDAL